MFENMNFKKLDKMGLIASISSLVIGIFVFIMAILKTVGMIIYNNDISEIIDISGAALSQFLTYGNYLGITFFYLFGISIVVFSILSIVFSHKPYAVLLPFILILFFISFYFVYIYFYLDDLEIKNGGFVEFNQLLDRYSPYDIFVLSVSIIYIFYYVFYFFLFNNFITKKEEEDLEERLKKEIDEETELNKKNKQKNS